MPYDRLLGQMVTIREDGRERRVTAAEAFLLHLTKVSLGGNSSASAALLKSIEEARSKRPDRSAERARQFNISYVGVGSVAPAIVKLGIAQRVGRSLDIGIVKLQKWIIDAALARLEVPLTIEQQRIVWDAVIRPEKLAWPEWWETDRGNAPSD